MARCVFCDERPKKWSSEHIIPQWLLDYLAIDAKDQLFQGVEGLAEFVKRERVHGTRQFVEGRVCEPCNTQWMSRLETTAKPTVTELLEGRRGPHELTREEAATVSKWATKNAYLLANVSLAGKPVPPAHIRSLSGDNGTIPEGVGVFAYLTAHDQTASFLQEAYWPQLLPPTVEKLVSTPDDAYKIGVQYKHIYFVVAYWPQQPNILAIPAGIHIPIWPRRRFWPCYVNTSRIGFGQSLPLLKSLCDTVVVVVKPEETLQ